MSKFLQGWAYPARYLAREQKALGLLGGAVMFLSMPLLAQQATLSVGSAKVPAGSSVSVGVSIADSGGIEPASLQWTLQYPTADIASVNVSAGSAAAAASKTVSCSPGSGTVTCVLYGLNYGVISPGTVANVSFQVNSAAPDATAPIQISSVSIAAVDGSVIASAGTGGTLSVTKPGPPPPPPPPPPSVQLSSLSCTPASIGSGGVSTCTVTMTGATKSNTAISLSSNSGLVQVPSSVTVLAGSSRVNFNATARTITATTSATVTASSAGISKAFALTLTSGSPAPSISIWNSTATPGTVNDGDSNATEVGTKFRSDVAGQVTAVRFYKGSRNAGTHVGHLWTKSGALLATVTFTNETGSGWQQANLSNPVSIQANSTYVVSYYAPSGHYSSDESFFRSAVNNSTLHALQDGADGGNGVYVYGRSGFPNQSWNASNYWVDVAFKVSR